MKKIKETDKAPTVATGRMRQDNQSVRLSRCWATTAKTILLSREPAGFTRNSASTC